jgi:acetolactate synthase-1/2/3 large subunit
MNRSFKESHQGVDLVSMFAPVTKWSALVATPGAVPEMIRKAFKLAQTERPGAVYLAIPEDVEQAQALEGEELLTVNVPRLDEPSPGQVERAAALLRAAHAPIVLAGHGATPGAAAAAGPLLGGPVAAAARRERVSGLEHPHTLTAQYELAHWTGGRATRPPPGICPPGCYPRSSGSSARSTRTP